MDYINVNDVTDVNKLKALYYDQLVIKQQADSNLVIINQRINELLVTATTREGDKSNGSTVVSPTDVTLNNGI